MNRSRMQILVLFCLSALSASGGDWRQFRGPQGNGVSEEQGLPTNLDAGRNIAWKSSLLAGAFPAPSW